MSVAIALPDEIASLLIEHEGEINRCVAQAVVWQEFQRGRISAGRAAELLALDRQAFEELRRERGIPLPFTSEELEHDLNWARTWQVAE